MYSGSSLDILFRDEYYVAVHKPSGLLVHRTNLDPANTESAVHTLSEQLETKVFPLHRLDRPTSGVLVFALSSESARVLAKKFEQHEVKKTYRAIVRGHFKETLELNYPLREELDEYSDRQAQTNKNAQEAQTVFRPLATVELPYTVDRYPSARYSMIEAIPKTGRKHQIRRHLAHLRHPIIGDANHGVGAHNRFFKEHFGIHRLLLACTELGFQHPITEEKILIKAPLAIEFQELVQKLGWGAHA